MPSRTPLHKTSVSPPLRQGDRGEQRRASAWRKNHALSALVRVVSLILPCPVSCAVDPFSYQSIFLVSLYPDAQSGEGARTGGAAALVPGAEQGHPINDGQAPAASRMDRVDVAEEGRLAAVATGATRTIAGGSSGERAGVIQGLFLSAWLVKLRTRVSVQNQQKKYNFSVMHICRPKLEI